MRDRFMPAEGANGSRLCAALGRDDLREKARPSIPSAVTPDERRESRGLLVARAVAGARQPLPASSRTQRSATREDARKGRGKKHLPRTPSRPGWRRADHRNREGKGVSRPVSRVLYGATLLPHVTAIHLGRPLPGASRNQPGRLVWKGPDSLRNPRRPYSVLLPVGFTVPLPLPVARWALTPPFHPYRGRSRGGLLSVALSLGSPPPGVTRHRFSVEPGLSSPAAFPHLQERPSSRLTRDWYAPRALRSSATLLGPCQSARHRLGACLRLPALRAGKADDEAGRVAGDAIGREGRDAEAEGVDPRGDRKVVDRPGKAQGKLHAANRVRHIRRRT